MSASASSDGLGAGPVTAPGGRSVGSHRPMMARRADAQATAASMPRRRTTAAPAGHRRRHEGGYQGGRGSAPRVVTG